MPVLSPCLPLIHSFGHTNGLDVIRSFILFKYTSGVCVRFQMSPADDDKSFKDIKGSLKVILCFMKCQMYQVDNLIEESVQK